MVLRYLRGTTHYGFCITQSDDFSLYTYLDADWVGDIDDRSSTSGYILFFAIYYSLALTRLLGHLRSNIVLLDLQLKQSTVLLQMLSQKVFGVKNLLLELGIPQRNPIFQSSMKHIAVGFNFVCNLVLHKQIDVIHVLVAYHLAS